jgi:hypothetical protein
MPPHYSGTWDFKHAAENEPCRRPQVYFSTRIKSPLDAFTATFSL